MTTLPAVNAGATTLLDTTPHTDTPPRADTLIQHADADAHAGDAIARFTASHEMHPLAQQHAYVKQSGGAQGSA